MARVSIADFVVISRVCLGRSKVVCSVVSALASGAFTLRIKRWATGPPSSPPQTKPKVALAKPRAMAPCTAKSFSKVAPQPVAVPWPPTKVTDPVINPVIGLSPKRLARLMPTTFCRTIKTPTTSVNKTSGLPPARSLEKSALRPIEAKNISIKPSCMLLSIAKENPFHECSTSTKNEASNPPATGSGILNSLRKRMRWTILRPISSTMVAAIKV